MNKSTKMFRGIFDNDNTALIPELWAQESLEQLEKEMITPLLVYREFSSAVAEFGEVVNAWRPQDMIASNRRDKQAVKTSDAIVTKVPVKLDQWIHQSILLGDGESAKSFQDLINVHVVPAARSIADKVDQIVTVQLYQFMDNVVGRLGQSQDKSTMIEARKVMQTNGVDKRDRNYLVGPQGEADLLNISEFLTADKIGDDGTALREGSLGQKLGFNIWMNQNVPSITNIPAADKVAAIVNEGTGYDAGETAIVVDGVAGTFEAGMWIVIDGEDVPHRLAAAGALLLTLEKGLVRSIGDDSAIVGYKAALVNQPATNLPETGNATGYPADYAEEISIDGLADAPGLGRLMTLGNGATAIDTFGLVGRNTANVIDLDHPLNAGLADDQKLYFGPEGEYSFAFHRNAIALVTRPLPSPSSSNVSSFVAEYNGLTMRATITYDSTFMCTRVNLDMLCGVKVLDERMGVVILSS